MSDRRVEDMSTFELSRWYALMDAVNVVADACEERGKSFDKMKISPLDITKYIESTCDTFAKKIEVEKHEEVKYADLRAKHITISLPRLAIQLQETI